MMNVRGQAAYEHESWPPEDLEAHLAFLRRFNRELVETGELVAVVALTSPDRALRVRADGDPVTDGVFPETKEFLAGYWMVDVDSAERACELAARASAAPGRGGAPLNLEIEVRQVMVDAAADLF